MMLQLYLFVLSCASIREVCSHVGALLFAIEASVKIRNTKTVTEEKAYWMHPQLKLSTRWSTNALKT